MFHVVSVISRGTQTFTNSQEWLKSSSYLSYTVCTSSFTIALLWPEALHFPVRKLCIFLTGKGKFFPMDCKPITNGCTVGNVVGWELQTHKRVFSATPLIISNTSFLLLWNFTLDPFYRLVSDTVLALLYLSSHLLPPRYCACASH